MWIAHSFPDSEFWCGSAGGGFMRPGARRCATPKFTTRGKIHYPEDQNSPSGAEFTMQKRIHYPQENSPAGAASMRSGARHCAKSCLWLRILTPLAAETGTFVPPLDHPSVKMHVSSPPSKLHSSLEIIFWDAISGLDHAGVQFQGLARKLLFVFWVPEDRPR